MVAVVAVVVARAAPVADPRGLVDLRGLLELVEDLYWAIEERHQTSWEKNLHLPPPDQAQPEGKRSVRREDRQTQEEGRQLVIPGPAARRTVAWLVGAAVASTPPAASCPIAAEGPDRAGCSSRIVL